jgi:hypothetical protein
MPVEVSTTIDRPVGVVWHFWAVDHVRNHPRWDPDMELEQISDGPMGLGTRIRRRNLRWGTPVEGEMEVVNGSLSTPSGSTFTTRTWRRVVVPPSRLKGLTARC